MAATWPRYLFFIYLLNQWTNLLQNFTKFMQFLSVMYRTVTKHILSKTRWRRLDLDTCFSYISWTNGPICFKISPNLCNFYLLWPGISFAEVRDLQWLDRRHCRLVIIIIIPPFCVRTFRRLLLRNRTRYKKMKNIFWITSSWSRE